jgi:hypothetical protein
LENRDLNAENHQSENIVPVAVGIIATCALSEKLLFASL